MVQRDTPWAPGTPCWVDLGVDNLEEGKAFYGDLFGWEFSEGSAETGFYSVITKDGRDIGGIAPKMSAAQPTAWTTYLATDNADETAAKVKANGGQVFAEPMDVMDFGRMALAIDPGGAFFGIWQSGTTTGFKVANEFDTPTWNENMTRNFEGNKAFYASVFGYTFDDMSSDDFKYVVLMIDGNAVGGLGEQGAESGPDAQPNWTTYFAVEDTDLALEKVVKLGGAVLAEPVDTPYGRLAVVSDPQGGVFAIMKNAQPADA
jgi:predicted enzyme related to lactoylglutathione lyase